MAKPDLTKEALGFVPGVGTAMDVADVAKSVATGDYVGAAVNTAATVLGIVPGVGRVAGKGLKAVAKTFRQADIEDAKKLMSDSVEKEVWKKANKVQQKQKRVPEVQEAAEKLSEGKITSKEYRRAVKKNQPIDLITEEKFPELPSLKSITGALDSNKVEKGIVGINKAIPDGTRVGSRLDIPAYEDYDTWVVSLHDGTTAGGKAIGYAQTAILKNVEFKTSAKGGLNIAKGKTPKSTIARIHGDYYNADPEDTYALSKQLLNDPEWTQVGMNPFRHSYFYNKVTGQPVLEAKEVVQVGPLVLAKGIKVPSVSDLKSLKIKTPDKKIRMFNEGGGVMEDQMKFAFMNEGGVLADDGVERDPVSGNEVPAGSMAEEVRDDVPAMLSEGEYVVPADVVRYHGIDKFEDLRDEAKMGLARMEADGRIGGQPVEEQEEFPFPVEELEGFNEGGAVGDTYSDVTGSDFRANQPYGAGGGRFPGIGFELRNFTNPKTGKTVVIPFFNGRPMQYLPPDFLEGGATTTQGGTIDPSNRQEDEAEKTRLVNEFGTNPMELTPVAKGIVDKVIAGETTGQQTKPFSQYSPEEFGTYLKQRQSGIGKFIDNLPILGPLLTMQDESAREFARKSLIQGKNFVTGEPITNKEADILMQVADMPEGRNFIQVIDDFLQGKTSLPGGPTYKGTKPIVVDDRPPIDTELRRTTYEPDAAVDTTTKPSDEPQTQDVSNLYGRGFTPEQIGEAPVQVQDGTATQPSSGFNLDSALFSAAEASMPKGQNIPFTQTKMKGYADIKASGTKQDYENLLQRIVVAEAGSEDLIGQALVARSILNRKGVLDDSFSPSTYYTNSSDLVDIIYGGTAESGVDKLLGGNVQKAIQQGKGYQYEPVGKGIITDPSKFNSANMTEASSAIALAQNPTKLRQELRKAGYKPNEIKNLMASTGFANLQTQADRGVKDDKTQDVGRVKYGKHTFNIAGNTNKKVYNPNPYEGTTDQGALTFAGVPPTSPFETGTAVAGEASQPLQQTFVPSQAPTADQIRLAGGVDAFVKSQLPTGTEQKTTGLQDLPVGVSIEADGQFTGTGGLGAVQDVDPLRADIQNRFAKSREPKTATMFRGLGKEYDKAKEQASLATLQKGIQKTGQIGPPTLEQQMAGLTGTVQPSSAFGSAPTIGGLGQVTGTSGTLPQVGSTAPQPVAPFTPLSKPSDIAKLMPSTADIEAQKAAEARKAREEQEKKIYEETQARIAKQMADAAKEQPQTLETLKKDRAEKDRVKKTNQMNQARQDVFMATGDAFEADKAAHAVFLDQSAEIRRNQELNKGKTLTQVIQEENRRDEDSGGGSGGGGFGGGSSGGGGDDKIVCTEMYRQTQLVDWQKAMKIWDVYQRRYLTPEHQIGYHWLFKPYVKGMQSNKLLTKLGAALAKKRTQHLKHILTKGKAKDDLVGKLWCSIIHPIVHKAGKIKTFLDSKTKAT